MKNATVMAGLMAVLVISTSSFAADDAITIPAGSELHVQIITTLSTKENETGDLWTAKVVEPIFVKGEEAIRAGSTVDGHITVTKGTKGKGEMRLVADSITTPDSSKYNIVAGTDQGTKEKTSQAVGGDAKGTAVETGVDADAAAFAPKKRGKDTVLPQGTEMTFIISRDTVAKRLASQPN